MWRIKHTRPRARSLLHALLLQQLLLLHLFQTRCRRGDGTTRLVIVIAGGRGRRQRAAVNVDLLVLLVASGGARRGSGGARRRIRSRRSRGRGDIVIVVVVECTRTKKHGRGGLEGEQMWGRWNEGTRDTRRAESKTAWPISMSRRSAEPTAKSVRKKFQMPSRNFCCRRTVIKAVFATLSSLTVISLRVEAIRDCNMLNAVCANVVSLAPAICRLTKRCASLGSVLYCCTTYCTVLLSLAAQGTGMH